MNQGGWSWTNPDAPPAEPAPSGPTRRQIGMVAAATLAVAAALLALTILGGNGGSKLNPIAQAAVRTASYPGERIAISGSYTFPTVPQPVQMHGGGVFNGDTKQGRLSLSIDASGSTPAVEINELIDGSDFYLSSPSFAGQLPDGKSWMKISVSSLDADTAASSQSDPTQQLKLLEQVSDEFTTIGTESVRGHETTHYSASVSYQKEADQLRSMGNDKGADLIGQLAEKSGSSGFPVEVWIDDKNLVRRASLSIPVPVGDDQTFTMNMSMEFFDFGAKPRIFLPPESQVFDASDTIKELTG